jgi:hypothetical protein
MPVIEANQRGIGRCGRLCITLSHHATYFLAKRFRRAIPITCVLGYPRSGTVWASQMAADYLQLPLPDLSLFPLGCPAVLHGHQAIEKHGPPALYVVRDGRDAMVSMYYYLRRMIPGKDGSQAPRRLRRYFAQARDLDDIRTNLPQFIEAQCRRPVGTPYHWARHYASVAASGRTDVPVLRYEAMKEDCVAALTQAMTQFLGKPADAERVRQTVDRFSFARQSGRKPGQEDAAAFVRKGEVGDWVNHFNRDAARAFDRWCGPALWELGYENDPNWTERLPQQG